MPITGNGWELHVNRLGIQIAGARKRTYGAYQVYLNGQQVAGLSGFMCECIGPGDNTTPQNGKRIQAGRYPLWTQFGNYRTIGYSEDTTTPGLPPMPALRLEGVGNRDGILIHPAHPPKLYLSSIGCLNPSNPLEPSELINFWDSRSRVIAFMGNLRQFALGAFQHEASTRVTNSWVVIDGEPMNVLSGTNVSASAATAMEPASLPISKTAAIQC